MNTLQSRLAHPRSSDQPRLVPFVLIGLLFIALLFSSAGIGVSLAQANTPAAIELTDKERHYLLNKNTLTMVGDPSWPPYDYVNSAGQHVGIAADYLRILSNRIGVPFKLIRTQSWSDAVILARAGRCDLVTILNKTPEREQYLDFTDSYFTTQVVIVGKETLWLENGLDDIQNKTIAVVKNYWIEEAIQSAYPDISLIQAETTKEAMELVADGKAFATVATFIEASHLIRKTAFSSPLEVIGHTPYTNKLRIGVRKGDEILLSIMQKAVRSLTDEEKSYIFETWVSPKEESHFNQTVLYVVLGLLGFALLAFFYWGRNKG